MSAPLRILFLCTGNSGRTMLAEAIRRARGGQRVVAYSAGSNPRGTVHPVAFAVLRARGLPTAGLASKSWDVFTGPEAPAFDLVVTVCDAAASEPCPGFFGRCRRLCRSIPDPAVAGNDEQVRPAFEQVADELERRIAARFADLEAAPSTSG